MSIVRKLRAPRPRPVRSERPSWTTVAVILLGPTALATGWCLALVGRGGSLPGVVLSLVFSAIALGVVAWLASAAAEFFEDVSAPGPGDVGEGLGSLKDWVWSIVLLILATKLLVVLWAVATVSATLAAFVLGWIFTKSLALGLLAGLGTAIHAPLAQGLATLSLGRD